MEQEQKLIQAPCTVEDFKPRKDRSWRIVFETRALSGEEVKLLADSFQGEGWLVFSPNREVTVADVPKEAAEAGVKTPAQRLRNKIYRYWAATSSKGDFESFYRTQIEKLVEYFDSKIPEGE